MVFDIGYLAGVVAAVATIGAPIVAILGKIMQLLRQIEQAQNDIRLSKSENEILMKGTLACLKGLKEQGCNGPVSDAINEIEEFMLKKAHLEMIDVGKNIREARERVGITQRELAEKAGTTQRQIIRYENGEQDITVGRFERIAMALGLSLVDMIM